MPANDLVGKLDREYDNPDGELDFVYFLDGIEKDKRLFQKACLIFAQAIGE